MQHKTLLYLHIIFYCKDINPLTWWSMTNVYFARSIKFYSNGTLSHWWPLVSQWSHQNPLPMAALGVLTIYCLNSVNFWLLLLTTASDRAWPLRMQLGGLLYKSYEEIRPRLMVASSGSHQWLIVRLTLKSYDMHRHLINLTLLEKKFGILTRSLGGYFDIWSLYAYESESEWN